MSRPRKKVECQCGCSALGWPNEMREVTIEQALDHTMRQTQTVRRFQVLKECELPFREELGLMILLDQLVRAWVKTPSTTWQKINLLRMAWRWLRRILAAHRVLKIQHAIYQRTKGFEWARQHAIQSAVLFGSPRWLQGFLSRRMTARKQRREANAAIEEQLDIAEVEAQA